MARVGVRYLTNILLIGSMLLNTGCGIVHSGKAYSESSHQAIDTSIGQEVCSSGWTITSYWVNKEEFYTGPKVPAYDESGNVLGYYKKDFLEEVIVDAMGIGDGDRNNKGIINYNYDKAKSYRLTDFPEDYFGKEMIPWETVAANPSVAENTKVVIKDLKLNDGEQSLIDKIQGTSFYARDTMAATGKRIDIFVGYQDVAMNPDGTYDSKLTLKFNNATVCMTKP